jgi:excisionase family DNA binding protein
MKSNGVGSMTDSIPCALLTVEQFRELIRQEFQAALNGSAERNRDQRSDKQFLTVRDVAKMTTLGISTIRRDIKRGKLKVERSGKRIFISTCAVENYVGAGPA